MELYQSFVHLEIGKLVLASSSMEQNLVRTL